MEKDKPTPLISAQIYVRPDLSILVRAGDRAIEVHLTPEQALSLGQELFYLALEALHDQSIIGKEPHALQNFVAPAGAH